MATQVFGPSDRVRYLPMHRSDWHGRVFEVERVATTHGRTAYRVRPEGTSPTILLDVEVFPPDSNWIINPGRVSYILSLATFSSPERSRVIRLKTLRCNDNVYFRWSPLPDTFLTFFSFRDTSDPSTFRLWVVGLEQYKGMDEIDLESLTPMKVGMDALLHVEEETSRGP